MLPITPTVTTRPGIGNTVLVLPQIDPVMTFRFDLEMKEVDLL
jgi:hypothetical protein